MPRDDLGQALKLLRFVRGWTERQLARAAGVRDRLVGQYERGERRPEAEELRRLVAAMRFPPDAVERAQRFLAGLREPGPQQEVVAARPPEATGALEQEVEGLEAEMDAVRSHLGRLLRELARRDG